MTHLNRKEILHDLMFIDCGYMWHFNGFDKNWREPLMKQTWEKIKNNYVEDVSSKELIESAIEGMLGSLDPHSTFLNNQELNELKVQTKGEFGGLGIEVTLENGFVKVISPIDDTPAAKAGIKSGDYIVKIGKEQVQGKSLLEAVKLMRGPVGTSI